MPGLGLFFDFEIYSSCEKRELAENPKFELSHEYLDQFEDYFNDHFGFRNLMNYINGSIKYYFFNSSIKPQTAITGKDGWLYYTSVQDRIMGSYSNKNLLSDAELIETIDTWEKRKVLLDSSNIEYYMVVWPNKSTIYPEFVPYRMLKQKIDTFSKVDQIISYLKINNLPVELIDPRKDLLEQKEHSRIYCKHDSHWNELGSFFAYQKFMVKMNITPFQLSDFNISWEETKRGGLIDVMGLCHSERIIEELPKFELKDTTLTFTHETTDFDRMFYTRNDSSPSDKRVLIFRDSYSSALVQFISLHFSETYYVWTNYHHPFVEIVKPDIVIVATVERYL